MSQSPKIRLVRPPSDGEPPQLDSKSGQVHWLSRTLQAGRDFLVDFFTSYEVEENLPQEDIRAILAEYDAQEKDLTPAASEANHRKQRFELLNRILEKRLPFLMKEKATAQKIRVYFAIRLGLGYTLD